MKKILMISGVIFACLNLNVQAQNAHFGIKGGLNLSDISTSNTNYTTGFHVGVLAHIHAAKRFAVQPELLYSTQGAKYKNLTDYKIKQDYINLPVMFQYLVNDGWRFETGPQIGFLINAKTKNGDVETDVKDNLDKVDFSWGFGIGYITHSKWGVDARFNLGITDNSKNNLIENKNRVFQVGLFYQFDKR